MRNGFGPIDKTPSKTGASLAYSGGEPGRRFCCRRRRARFAIDRAAKERAAFISPTSPTPGRQPSKEIGRQEAGACIDHPEEKGFG